jgi:DNA-binding MarR family transcriptional regulator
MSHTEHPVFDGFQTLWAFNPKKQTDITHNELLIYSALSHADRRNQCPNNVDLSWRTGLDRNTVARVLTSLNEKKLVNDRTPLERTDLFLSAKKNSSEHWSQRLRFWKCLVRSEGSKLAVSDQSVLSYVWWSKITGFDPPKGWSERYIASIIKLKNETVERAIARLEQMELMRRNGKQWLVPKYLSELQANWFIRKEVNHAEKVTLGEFEPDMRKLGHGYAPGEIVVAAEQQITPPEIASAPLAEMIKVSEYLNPLLRGHGIGDAARYRIIQAARRDLEQVGTDGHEWKPIVDMYLERYLDDQQRTSEVSSTKVVVENEAFLQILETSDV